MSNYSHKLVNWFNEDISTESDHIQKFKKLHDFMRFYESHLRIMHWNSAGEEFNDNHVNITEKYYEMISKHIDEIAEIMGIFNIFPDGYVEVCSVVNFDNTGIHIDANKYYTRAESIEVIDKIFGHLIELFVDVLKEGIIEDPKYAGVKSTLEDILYQYTFQKDYINKRRTI